MNTAAIILAAGLSSRMGEFKPLLPVGETAAIVRTVRSAAACDTVVVVAGHRGGELSDALRDENAAVVFNPDYATGMFSSVLCGLKALPRNSEAFFLMPADCCAVAPDTLRRLIAAFSGEIVYPAFSGKTGHPPLIPTRHADGLLKHDGAQGAKGYLRGQRSHTLEVPDPGILLDMDTPDDYSKLLRHLGIATYPGDPDGLLRKYETPRDIAEHGRHVARICSVIAERLQRGGTSVDVPLLLSAAVVHDIARAGDDHAEQGAGLLLRNGFPDAARLVRTHMEPPPPDASVEEKILYLADKLCRRGEIVMPDVQLARMTERFTGDEAAIEAARTRLARCAKLLREFDLSSADFR